MAAAPATTVWSVVRDILSTNLSLTADEVITRAKARGLKAPDAAIRGTVHTVRKKLKKKVSRPAKVAPAAARQTPAPAKAATPSVSSVVRSILSADLSLTADQVIVKADSMGVDAPDATIRALVYNIRGELKRKAAPAPKSAVPASKPARAPVAVPVVSAQPAPAGVSAVLSNVALVNTVVAATGGVEQARQVAEAVRACGGADAFAQYLDLVAGIRTGGAAQ
jgi:hypothetical protein